MQLARQTNLETESGDRTDKKSKRDARAGTIAAIHITWKKLRSDLKGDKDELREQRLAFMSQVLNRPVRSSRDLTLSKLGKVLDAMRELERAPLLPGAEILRAPTVARAAAPQGDVVHLATTAQVEVINKLFLHLGWSMEAIDGFLLKRFKVKSHRMLTPAQANSLTMILLTIGAANAIRKRSNVQRVSRPMIRAEIPALKQRLGIDQGNIDPMATNNEGPDTEEEEWL